MTAPALIEVELPCSCGQSFRTGAGLASHQRHTGHADPELQVPPTARQAWRALVDALNDEKDAAREVFSNALNRVGGRVEHRERYG